MAIVFNNLSAGGGGSWREITFSELKTFIKNNDLKEIYVKVKDYITGFSFNQFSSPIMLITDGAASGNGIISHTNSGTHSQCVFYFYFSSTSGSISYTIYSFNTQTTTPTVTNKTYWSSHIQTVPPDKIKFYIKD